MIFSATLTAKQAKQIARMCKRFLQSFVPAWVRAGARVTLDTSTTTLTATHAGCTYTGNSVAFDAVYAVVVFGKVG